MDIVYIISGIFGIIWTILNVRLFFKVWGMTNDVARLTEFIINGKDIYNVNNINENIIDSDNAKDTIVVIDTADGISVGDTVNCKPLGKELVILSIKDGTFECYSPEEAKSYGYYSKQDLELL